MNKKETIKSFMEYHKDHLHSDVYGDITPIVKDAEIVYNKFKTIDTINKFAQMTPEEQYTLLPELEKTEHSAGTFSIMLNCAQKYANYIQKTFPQLYAKHSYENHMKNPLILTFDEYYKNFSSDIYGKDMDKILIDDAKAVYEKNKTPKAICKFYESPWQIQYLMVPRLRKSDHSAHSFKLVCNLALNYAEYMKKNKSSFTDRFRSISNIHHDSSIITNFIRALKSR